jgi:hypothetical protein
MVLTCVTTICFGLFAHRFWIRFLILVAVLAVAPAVLPTCRFLMKLASAIYRRFVLYERLRTDWQQLSSKLGDCQQKLALANHEIVGLLQNSYRRQAFEIHCVFCYNEVVTLKFLKTTTKIKLARGRKLRVVDIADQKPLGLFIINEEFADSYNAAAIEMDPLWKGSVISNRLTQQYPPPNTIAFLLEEYEDANTI